MCKISDLTLGCSVMWRGPSKHWNEIHLFKCNPLQWIPSLVSLIIFFSPTNYKEHKSPQGYIARCQVCVAVCIRLIISIALMGEGACGACQGAASLACRDLGRAWCNWTTTKQLHLAWGQLIHYTLGNCSRAHQGRIKYIITQCVA